ncbi:phage holin [Lachnospiraceae bacterium CLA-AA-H215]|jgi:phi LC3 family holin|uniref:Phage holin n=1 Tax=Hominifimenecus microfluidus TaxID=2885348 RepID=A0AAE3E9N9_9FIRM|nr:phage holin [Hominifimenecus microfluidus]MCC2231107.1 phage holin [Hominifimenecus microfluidus]
MINWKLRLKNKATLLAIVTAVIALIYQILGMLGIVPAVSESEVTQAVGLVINILAMVGIVTDPTTQGVSDSDRALTYDKPAKNSTTNDYDFD